VPTIHTRAEWGAVSVAHDFSELAAEGIVIHNMQNANRAPQEGNAELQKAFEVSRICQHDHMVGNGWRDIGQHFTVSRGGVIMEARKGSLDGASRGRVVQGAHACGVTKYNTKWFGIEIEGDNRQEDRVTEQQWAALVDLASWLSGNAGLDRSLPMLPHFEVHEDCTDCPGEFGRRVEALQQAVDEAMAAGGGVAPQAAGLSAAAAISEELAGARGLAVGPRHLEQRRELMFNGLTERREERGSCSEGWYVTGYFTPVETEFSGPERSISIPGHGTESFKGSFLSKVRIEGWGRTRFGWCVGRYGGSWHKSDEPQDAGGHPLREGSLARDPDLIPAGSEVTIPSLPEPWNTTVFTPNDTGGAITGYHVDLYCGEGSQAEQMTFRITGHGNRLCYT
jgi:3D (Asp-Asp-Asp) domain-containing protein